MKFQLTFTQVLDFDVGAVVAVDIDSLGASSHAQAGTLLPGAGRLVLEAVDTRVARVGTGAWCHGFIT